MAVLIGGTDAHYVANRGGTFLPHTRIQVRALIGGGAVIPQQPVNWEGQDFPVGYAVTNAFGFYRFLVPDGTGVVEIRPVTDAGVALGSWRVPTGQVMPGGPLEAFLANAAPGGVSFELDPDGVPVLVIGDTSDLTLDTDPDGTTVLVIPGV